ncbi:hypothetical protein CLU79DRAFT_289842 [Phycomyces nitens]|nr:hypothetical protein CLU79DRAFT_289842 [Phycomyces nitens]
MPRRATTDLFFFFLFFSIPMIVQPTIDPRNRRLSWSEFPFSPKMSRIESTWTIERGIRGTLFYTCIYSGYKIQILVLVTSSKELERRATLDLLYLN